MSNKKRKCLSLIEKVSIVKCAKTNPSFGAQRLVDKFEIGRIQIQAILQKKESILASFESHEGESSVMFTRCFAAGTVTVRVQTYLPQVL